MGRHCIVRDCSTGGPKVQVHRFPTGVSSSEIRSQWIVAALQTQLNSPHLEATVKNGGVCSRHFQPEDYRNWNEDVEPVFWKLGRLKPESIPSINIPVTAAATDATPTGDEIADSSEDSSALKSLNNLSVSLDLEQLKSKVEKLTATIQQKNKTIASLRKKLIKSESAMASRDNRILELEGALGKLFSINEIRILEDRVNKYVHYEEDEMEKAITLHTMSTRCYEHLRNLGFPFPASSTVHRWLQKVEVFPGRIISPVLRVIKKNMLQAKQVDPICAIALDEMKIDPKYTYDMHADAVLGGHDEGCVVTVRGLFASWKYIVHFDWIKNPSYLDWLRVLVRVRHLNKKAEDDRFKLQEIKRRAREEKKNITEEDEDDEATPSIADLRETELEEFESNLEDTDFLLGLFRV